MKMDNLPTKKHFTTEGFILNPAKSKSLLIFHKKVKKWIPAGGHIEENEIPDKSVLREIKEELGIEAKLLNPYIQIDLTNSPETQLATPYCVFMETLKASSKDVEHCHLDLVYLLEASEDEKLTLEDGIEARWFTLDEILKLDTFESIKRIAENLLV